MTKLTAIAACAISFLLGTVVPISTTHAQSTQKATYYELSFMKSLPGQDPVALEDSKCKPIHMDLVKSGTIKSWKVLSPVYAGAHNYDYMTLITFDDLAAYQKLSYLSLFKKYWGEDKWRDVMKQTDEARDSIGGELWQVSTGTEQ